jgi:hypothetical protein
MGANATTFVPSYTSGEVLTAANLSVTNSGIPVFATTVTRDAAFGGTGEKTLAEGQFAYIEATNTTQYYDGAAWQSVGVAPGLVFITGASFTTASSVSLPTSTFTSTYANYRILLSITSTTADANTNIRFRSAGTDNSTSNYYSGGISRSYGGTTGTQEASSDTNGYLFGSSTGIGGYRSIDIFGPQLTQMTAVNSINTAATGVNGSASFSGVLFAATTSFDSMSFIPASGTITGNYKVYGYSNS